MNDDDEEPTLTDRCECGHTLREHTEGGRCVTCELRDFACGEFQWAPPDPPPEPKDED